ncbi:MAG: D-alanine--D-alanine ligase family protein [Bacillota bacterium]
MERKKVAVIFGGRSGEHVVSLRSAASIMEAIDTEQYEVIPIGITREGIWFTGPDVWMSLWEKKDFGKLSRAALLTDPTNPGLLIQNETAKTKWYFQPLDLVFPVLHGTYGEDGTIQGLFEMAGLPYVGSGVLASSSSMDKVVMKELFAQAGLPVAPFLFFHRNQWSGCEVFWQKKVTTALGYPCFVKPANLGSSLGITKVKRAVDLSPAVEEALLYDEKVVIEAYIEGREIECAVLGNLDARVSRPGEVIPCNEFYDYRAKYIDDRSTLVIPVELGEELEQLVKKYSLKSFQAVGASGLARVDFFVNIANESVIINEINTMPGFTSVSMYSKLWDVCGVNYSMLVSRLIELAEERFQRRNSLLHAPPE